MTVFVRFISTALYFSDINLKNELDPASMINDILNIKC